MIRIKQHVWLKDFSPIEIGGPAEYFVVIQSIDELQEALNFAKEKKKLFFLFGRGSKCLFDDRGFKGIVIKNQIETVCFHENILEVGSGVYLPDLSIQCTQKNLSGFEFSAAIPGTIGGALYMNASAHGESISSHLKDVTVLTSQGKIEHRPSSTLEFGYRMSSFQKTRELILSATFELESSTDVKERVKSFLLERKASQPTFQKSLGSTFKNPGKCLSAGALIDQCGLKGFQIGGAVISEKHANFILNTGNATSQDVVLLLEKIVQRVKREKGIDLEKEMIIVPYEEKQ